MKFRTTMMLLLAACVLAGMLWIIERRRHTWDANLPRDARMGIVRPEDVNYLMIEKEKFRVDLVRKNDRWHLQKPLSATADEGKIHEILGNLEAITVKERVTPAQRAKRNLSLDDYGLAKPRARFVLFDGLRRTELAVGLDSPLGDMLYVKLKGHEDVIATKLEVFTVIPDTVEALRDRTLLHGDASRTTRLEVQRPGTGFIQLLRQGGQWMIQQPVTTRADTSRITEMLDMLYSAKVREFTWDRMTMQENGAINAGLGSPTELYELTQDEAKARITVWVDDDQVSRQLILGKETGEKKEFLYAKRRDISSIYQVDRKILDVFSVSVNDLRDRRLFALTAAEVKYARFEKEDRKLTLERKQDAGWVITEPVQWEADNVAVNDLVRRLAGLQIAAFVDGSRTNLAELGLAPPSCIVELSDTKPEAVGAKPGKGRVNRLWVGRCSPEAKKVFVRFEHEPIRFGDGASVFEVPATVIRALGADMINPLAYRDRAMLSLDAANVRRITLTKGTATQIVEKNKAGQWVDAASPERKAKADIVEDILFFVSNMRAFRVESYNPKDLIPYGLDRPSASLTVGLSGKEGIQKKVLIGIGAGADGVYAMIQGQDVVFVLENGVVQRLTRELLEEQTAAATATPKKLSR